MTMDLRRMSDAVTPWAIRVVATLRVADHLAAGPAKTEELAHRVGADPDALGRVLRYLSQAGLFAEPAPGVFALTESGQVLRDDHPSGQRAWLDLDGAAGRIDLAFTGLLHTVRTGRPAYPEIHGRPFWADLADNDALAASFDALMAGHTSWFGQVRAAHDWSHVNTVIDVGGGTGELLIAIMHEVTHLTGSVVEVPATAEAARDAVARAGLAQRCTVVAGDFFAPLPAGADRYLLCNVLHDWDDERARTILRRCAEALGPEGSVLVIEELADSGHDPSHVARMDLRMLVLTGGRQRSVDALCALAAGAGLSPAGTVPTPSGHSVIEFRRGE